MSYELGLYALHLTKSIEISDIESLLNIKMKKGIEATYYAQIDNKMITMTNFNVLTIINWSDEEINDIFNSLGIDYLKEQIKYVYQDYPIIIDETLDKNFIIDNQTIKLKEFSLINMLIISHVISQSVALEVYENKLSEYYQQSRNLIDTSDTFSIFKRTKLSKFAKKLVLLRHDILIDLYLLDKPNILWDNEEAELLYIKLSYILELKDRFDVVEYKLNNIKDDIVMVMDLTNHNHSSFLEWIIIILIVIEVIMGLIEWFGIK